MNLALFNQSIEAQVRAGEEAKRFKTVLEAIDSACKSQNFKSYDDFVTQLAAFDKSTSLSPDEKKRDEKPKKRKKKTVTPEDKQAIIKDLEAGHTVAKIEKARGFSSSTINNIKKDAGLVKSKSPKETSPATPAGSGVATLVSSGPASTTG